MSTLTPNYGLIVPEETDNVSQVRADYATNLGIIDNISGGGGGGGGNVFGAFINTNDVIKAQTDFYSSMTYTATKDCFVGLYLVGQSNSSATIYIDSKKMYAIYYNAVYSEGSSVWLKEGQTLSITGTHSGIESYYIVYGIIQGTESIFTPIIYSDNERMIGIWRDNKPLYQKTLSFVGNINPNTTNNFADVSALNIDTFVSGLGNGYESGCGWEQLPTSTFRVHYNTNNGYLEAITGQMSISGTVYITIQYTKTTDVAGSGNWNTDGIPMVHYTTTEQVIGTYLGKPLYQKTISFTFTANQSNGTFWWCGNVDYTGLLPNDIERGWFVNGYYDTSGVHRNLMAGEIEINDHSILLFTNYSRSNVPAVATFQYTKTSD